MAMTPFRSTATTPRLVPARLGDRNQAVGAIHRGGSGPAVHPTASLCPVVPTSRLSLDKLRFSAVGLFGRDREVAALMAAYDRVRGRQQQRKPSEESSPLPSDSSKAGVGDDGGKRRIFRGGPSESALRRSLSSSHLMGRSRHNLSEAALRWRGLARTIKRRHPGDSPLANEGAGADVSMPELVLIKGRAGAGMSAVVRKLRDKIVGRNERIQLQRKHLEATAVMTVVEDEGEEKEDGNSEQASTDGTSPACAEAHHRAELPRTVEAFFIEGGFDSMLRASPYSAFASAFGELCDALSSLGREDDDSYDPEAFREVRRALRTAVSLEAAQDVAELVPGLIQLLSKDECDSDDKEAAAVTKGEEEIGWNVLLPDFSEHSVTAEKVDKSTSILSPKPSAYKGASRVAIEAVVEKLSNMNNGMHQLHFIVRQFLRVVCSPSRPVVMLLNDLQRADESSLGLLEAILTDSGISGLLVIGIIRSNEIQGKKDHSLLAKLYDIEHNREMTVTATELKNFDLETTNRYIAELLSSDPNETLELATIVDKRTRGNVFFVRQFLISIKEEGYLTFSIGTLKWLWDANEIDAKTIASNNVIDHMKRRLTRNLPHSGVKALVVASCLGETFSFSALVIALEALICSEIFHQLDKLNPDPDETGTSVCFLSVGESGTDTQSKLASRTFRSLSVSVAEGLIEPIGPQPSSCDGEPSPSELSKATYRFVAEPIKSAAFSLIPMESRDSFQQQIGCALLNNLAEEELEPLLFVTTDLQNCGRDLLCTVSDKTHLAQLNLRAGEKALASSSFNGAAHYLDVGISLLDPSTCWAEEMELSLTLHKAAVRVAHYNGEVEKMQLYSEKITARKDIPFQQKADVYIILVKSLGNREMSSEAIAMGDFALRKLGYKIVPKRGLKLATLIGFMKTKLLVRNHSSDSLLSCLKELDDMDKLNALKLVDNLSEYSYLSGRELTALLTLTTFRWTIRFGVSSFAPVAFSRYAAVLCGFLRGYKEARAYAELAEKLSEGHRSTYAKTHACILGFVKHWYTPLRLSLKPALATYQVGMETGDLKAALSSGSMFCHHAMWIGKPLSSVNADFQTFVQPTVEYKVDVVFMSMIPCWQSVQNLMGLSDDPTSLIGEIMDEVELRKTEPSDYIRHQIDFSKLWLLYYFAEYEAAWEMIKGGSGFDRVCAGRHILCRRSFCVGLTAFALANKTKKAKWKRRAKKAMKQISRWCDAGNVNCTHMLRLLEAEDEALSGDKDGALKKYNVAITTAGRYGFPQDKALANERAGLFFLNVEDEYWAAHYLGKARELYLEWEAMAKVRQLSVEHSDLLPTIDAVKFNNDSPQ